MFNGEEKAAAAQAHAVAKSAVARQLSSYGAATEPVGAWLQTLYNTCHAITDENDNVTAIKAGGVDILPDLRRFETGPMARVNAVARAFRANPRLKRFPTYGEMMKGDGALAKAALDVGTLTNLANVTGGQALGFVSLDVNMARGTIRPGSFTLYQMLKKSRANQIVDFWPYAADIGGAIPGAAYAAYSSATSGALGISAGIYDMKSITLKMALDGRAITMALAAQNSFVDVTKQETTNASMVVLQSVDWALYWGNPNIWANQPMGIYQTLKSFAPSNNIQDFQKYAATNPQGLSNEQLLFNMIYQQMAEVVKYRVFGIPTHAMMAPGTAADLQQLVTNQLRQIAATDKLFDDHGPIVINGNLQGMNTRFGDLLFPVDLVMTARDIPAQAMLRDDGSSPATSSAPTPPASVTAAVSGSTSAESDFTATWVASSGIYSYAVASTDSLMNESNLTYATSVSGVGALGAYQVTITPPAANDAAAFRVYRGGLGYKQENDTATGAAKAGKFRHIGDILANGTNPVVFTDLNNHIPGSETVFILDMDEEDDALDYRWLLPLTKIELFAQNIYMPWAVAHIGAPRVRIPKFHAMIENYVPQSVSWNPLSATNS